jgi:hypothetical protein
MAPTLRRRSLSRGAKRDVQYIPETSRQPARSNALVSRKVARLLVCQHLVMRHQWFDCTDVEFTGFTSVKFENDTWCKVPYHFAILSALNSKSRFRSMVLFVFIPFFELLKSLHNNACASKLNGLN